MAGAGMTASSGCRFVIAQQSVVHGLVPFFVPWRSPWKLSACLVGQVVAVACTGPADSITSTLISLDATALVAGDAQGCATLPFASWLPANHQLQDLLCLWVVRPPGGSTIHAVLHSNCAANMGSAPNVFAAMQALLCKLASELPYNGAAPGSLLGCSLLLHIAAAARLQQQHLQHAGTPASMPSRVMHLQHVE
ncbi:hypothetical protein COO60DRAFT_715496 [Scenedesmus sp. NREL 46B-D3]|nr:hypothetical protein COO60DRAFT_715496 [Scenedesmus sp. NREL 46B-D3]